MIVHEEHLYHFRCDANPNHWWSIADKKPRKGKKISCPHCRHINTIEAIASHLQNTDK